MQLALQAKYIPCRLWTVYAGEQDTHWEKMHKGNCHFNFFVFCPSGSHTLQHGSFIIPEWITTTGFFRVVNIHLPSSIYIVYWWSWRWPACRHLQVICDKEQGTRWWYARGGVPLRCLPHMRLLSYAHYFQVPQLHRLSWRIWVRKNLKHKSWLCCFETSRQSWIVTFTRINHGENVLFVNLWCFKNMKNYPLWSLLWNSQNRELRMLLCCKRRANWVWEN